MKTNDTRNQGDKAENLKTILKGFGITTPAELDKALSDALGALTIGIMTESPVKVNSA